MKVYTGAQTLESMSQANLYNKWTLNKFKKYLTGEILEVGCGVGNFTLTLASYGKVTAIDVDKSFIKKIVSKNPKIKAGFGNIERGVYFFEDKYFDTIVCINVLEHIKADNQALGNMFRLLKPGGTLILLVPIHQFLYGEIDRSIGHFRRYNSSELVTKILNLNLKIIMTRKLNLLGAIGWYVSSRILHNTSITPYKIKLFNLLSPILYIENIIEPPIGTSVLIIAKKI